MQPISLLPSGLKISRPEKPGIEHVSVLSTSLTHLATFSPSTRLKGRPPEQVDPAVRHSSVGPFKSVDTSTGKAAGPAEGTGCVQ